jgi:hypothetical protein
MDNQSFEQLAEQAASGLKSDRELYLDVKQELRLHLEEKAEHFAAEGHSPEESAELSRKSLGSPMDLAAELLDGNRNRMKLRGLLRMTFGALIVPLAIVLALYMGYGRFARLEQTIYAVMPLVGGEKQPALPTLPLFGAPGRPLEKIPALRQMYDPAHFPESIHRYWRAHRRDPDSHMYYAYYTLLLPMEGASEHSYTSAVRLGEQIEPQNALYNVLLADYYLKKGVKARAEKDNGRDKTVSDDLLDRRTFELGVAEMRKAAGKPYLHTYQDQMVRKKLSMEPRPVLTEDYIRLLVVKSAELYPNFARYRELARKVPGCARILISEGRNADAEDLMDTWKPYAKLLLDDSNSLLISQLVAQAAATILTKEGGPVYDKLGDRAKAREADVAYQRLVKVRKSWSRTSDFGRTRQDQIIKRHGSMLAGILLPIYGGVGATEEELKPGRMQEYVLGEEVFVEGLLSILALALLGTLLQGAMWLHRLRGAASISLLLVLPARDVARALLLGIALPLAVYLVYSRLPVIAGREFGLSGGMWPRFVAELVVLGIIILWIPTRIIRRGIRRRCADLDIPVPNAREETVVGWKVRLAVSAALVLAAASSFAPYYVQPNVSVCGVIIAAGIAYTVSRYAGRQRREHGIYYGTVARSLAPVYALSIILISLTVQPTLLFSEVKWLHGDTLFLGALVDNRSSAFVFNGVEARASQRYSQNLRKAIGE